MKDGIYRVVVTVDGVPTEAEALVENGVFKGLGHLAGIAGTFTFTEEPQDDVTLSPRFEGKLADA